EPQTQAPWEKCGDRHVGLDIAFSWKTQRKKAPSASSLFLCGFAPWRFKRSRSDSSEQQAQ
ncbi:hypothetical protein JW916_16465, partial [Candidatus Sumerlaeota bacterium]|nr:hypothetical protein [Candidatus Sumerlaeota bacterium]